MMSITRRNFLFTGSGLLALSFLPKITFAKFPQIFRPFDKHSPLAILNDSEFNSTDFNGDNIDLPHDILWNTIGFIDKSGGLPPPTEFYDVVVVGGGISGLFATYQLRDQNVLLLEQDKRVGGNSKGELYKGSEYSIGAAYICNPEEGNAIHSLLKDLDLLQQCKAESDEESSVFFNHQIRAGLWEGITDPQAKDQFIKINQELARIYNEDYPEIPLSDQGMNQEKIFELDKMSFENWLDQTFPFKDNKAHPHIKEYFQLYAWSSFGGSISEISAAQMINFISAETDQILALPGGNSKICEAMYLKIDPEKIRCNSFVLDIRSKGDSVEICYFTEEGKLKTIQAKKCIFAAPKMIADKVISEIPDQQLKAIESLNYRAYVVANIILKNKIKSQNFELYCLEGQIPPAPSAMNQGDRYFTDICFGTWAQDENVEHSVLTIYRSLPFDGARQFLFSPFAHGKNRQKILEAIKPQLVALNLTEDDILGIRLTRWGHCLPLAQVGHLANGTAQLAAQPIGNKIFFANQDNYVNPSFEAAIASTLEALKAMNQTICPGV